MYLASSVGIMVGAADPMMMFPEGTKFVPYAAMRNVSAKEVLVAPSAHYMNGNTPVTVRLRPFRMRANEAAQLDLPAELAAAGVPSNIGMLTLAFSSTAAATDLLLATGSVDQTGSYVFEVECKGSGPSEGKILGNWNVADGNDTMVSVWNSSDSDQDLTAVLFYSGGQYKYPVHLAKNASTMFNVSEIIMMQMPDADGNVIPVGTPHGSAVLSSATGQSDPLNVGVSVGTFNAQTATCGTKCPTCLGYADYWLDPNGFGLTVQNSAQVNAIAQLQNGSQIDKNTSISWSSTDSGVASSSGGGMFLGVSLGSFIGNGSINLISINQDCPYNGAPCGTDPYYGSTPGSVWDASLSCSTAVRGTSTTCTVTLTGNPSGATYSNWSFTDGSNTVNSGSTASTWSGVAVRAGTVSVRITVGSLFKDRSATLTVNPRNWHLNPDTTHPVPNGTSPLPLLDVPPKSTGHDSGAGFFNETTGHSAIASGVTAVSAGPNQGFGYYPTIPTFATTYLYEINPDLVDTGSAFYLHQCGGSSGFISGSDLLTQTQRHEAGAAASHYNNYQGGLLTDNPGDYIESLTASPGFNPATIDNQTLQDLNGLYTGIGVASSVEPFAVNETSIGTFLGNINYEPYTTCP